jgi:integrase
MAVWLDGIRVAPSTRASYEMNVRLHVAPYIGKVPLKMITPGMLSKLYRDLEASGRWDRRTGERTGEPLSARTVAYVGVIIAQALSAAVDDDLLARSPADKAKGPTAKEAKAPEMNPWNAAQLAAFLGWARENSADFPAWMTMAMTGMRRGELLGLRWRDIDLAGAAITVQRSVGTTGGTTAAGPTKSGKSRVVDIDAGTVAVLRAWKAEHGSLALALARDSALVFGTLNDKFRAPARFGTHFRETMARARVDLPDLPRIRLHDLRHTHATLLLQAGEPVHIVSQRLGHAGPTITLSTYSHVLPGDQKRAADRFAALVAEA